MKIVINDDELTTAVLKILKYHPDNNILIDHFLVRAKEAEVDAIFDGENVQIMGIMELELWEFTQGIPMPFFPFHPWRVCD